MVVLNLNQTLKPFCRELHWVVIQTDLNLAGHVEKSFAPQINWVYKPPVLTYKWIGACPHGAKLDDYRRDHRDRSSRDFPNVAPSTRLANQEIVQGLLLGGASSHRPQLAHQRSFATKPVTTGKSLHNACKLLRNAVIF